MTPLEIVLILSLVAALIGLIVGRIARNELRAEASMLKLKVAILNTENMDLARDLQAYKGAWNQIEHRRLMRDIENLTGGEL